MPLSPGERAEISCAVEPGERVVLRSEATAESAGMIDSIAAMNGGTDAFDVLELRAAAALDAAPDVPERLATLPPVDEAQAVDRPAASTLDGFEINGSEMDMGRIDETVTVDTTRALDRHATRARCRTASTCTTCSSASPRSTGRRRPPELSGWKDTIFARAETEFVLVLRFEDYADPDTPYMYHCHLLWHEDQGMMGQFAVVEPGQLPR